VDEYTVGEVAELARVTVRTLHHYDTIGLLTPSGRSSAGYRLYSTTDLTRLHQILFYRTLGFGLGEIPAILADPSVSVDDHLLRQRRLLHERIARDQALLEAVEKHMEARNTHITLTPEQQFEIFGTSEIEQRLAQAEERWGTYPSWQESVRRASTYSYEDWAMIKAEGDEIVRRFAEALRSGTPADDETAMDVAEEHRRYQSKWFFECDYTMQRGIAEHYLADPSYLSEVESRQPGFTQYVHDAIIANAQRAGKS
jgi:DNA-binding transcriptional MerR regulator